MRRLIGGHRRRLRKQSSSPHRAVRKEIAVERRSRPLPGVVHVGAQSAARRAAFGAIAPFGPRVVGPRAGAL